MSNKSNYENEPVNDGKRVGSEWPILSILPEFRTGQTKGYQAPERHVLLTARRPYSGEFDSPEKSPYRVDKPPIELLNELKKQINVQKEVYYATGSKAPSLAAVRIAPGSAFGDVARHIEAREFKQAWYPDVSYEEFDEEMHTEYGPYDQDSRFIMLVDSDNTDQNGLPYLVGMARMVGGRKELLKTVHDMQEVWQVSEEEILEDLQKCNNPRCALEGSVGHPDTTLDYSSFAVAKNYRGSDAYPIMSHELYHWSLENGANTVTTIFVKDFLTLYQFRGVPFRTIASVEPKIHMNEISSPAVMHLPEVPNMVGAPTNNRHVNGYRQMVEAEGLSFMPFKAG
jgi:hypothetical protein